MDWAEIVQRIEFDVIMSSVGQSLGGGGYKIIPINKIVVNVFYSWSRGSLNGGGTEWMVEGEGNSTVAGGYLFNIIFNQSHQINCL